MTTNGSGIGPPVTARALQVPVTADSVAPPRLVYGGLQLIPCTDEDDGYAAVYFPVAGSGALGRVTFEGLDAVRGARGEMPPYDLTSPRVPGDWVFTVESSPWLAERHHYEMQFYSTPLLQTHQHYVFWFHDEFVEAIAEGIWLDLADPARPWARPARHPLATLDPALPAQLTRSAAGIDWELRRAPVCDDDLIRDSALCSQRLYQLDLVLDGHSREAASIWLRTRNDQLTSRLIRPWPGGELARQDGIAHPRDFTQPWEAYLEGVAERRRARGR